MAITVVILNLLKFTSPFFVALLISTGCATAPKHDWTVKEINRGQTFMESKGAEAGKARLVKNSIATQNQNREFIRWGGVAVVLQDGQSAASEAGSHLQRFQDELVERLQKNTEYPGFKLVGLSAGLQDNQQAAAAPLILMVVLQNERVTITPLSVGKKVEYQVTGHVLFLDSKSAMQTTAAYPVAVTTVDLGETPISGLVNEALFSEKKASDGKSIGLIGQVADMLAEKAIVPRAVFPPVSVQRFSLQNNGGFLEKSLYLENKLQKQLSDMSESTASAWADELAGSLTVYLGANTGLPLNPYVAGGSEQKFTSDSVLSQAASLTMRTVDNQQMNSKLTAPRHVLNMSFSKFYLTESSDSSKRKTFQTTVNYGFDAVISLKNADTGKEVDRVVLKVGEGGKGLGPQAKKQGQIGEFVLKKDQLQNIQLHFSNLRSFLEEALLQLSREIAYPEEDWLKRFEKFRSNIKRNS